MPEAKDLYKAGTGVVTTEIPDKLYFRIGEVARLLEVPAYVLRFWESEFPQLKPNKGGTGQRLYRRRDVEMAVEIRRLLYVEGYTIPGARQSLKPKAETARSSAPELPPAPQPGLEEDDRAALRRLRTDLREIAALLSRPPAPSAPASIALARNGRRRGGIGQSFLGAAAGDPPPLFAVPPRNSGQE